MPYKKLEKASNKVRKLKSKRKVKKKSAELKKRRKARERRKRIKNNNPRSASEKVSATVHQSRQLAGELAPDVKMPKPSGEKSESPRFEQPDLGFLAGDSFDREFTFPGESGGDADSETRGPHVPDFGGFGFEGEGTELESEAEDENQKDRGPYVHGLNDGEGWF